MQDVIEARYLEDYKIWLRFEDGSEGEVDLEGELHGEVFEPLRDSSLPVSRSIGTPVRSNGQTAPTWRPNSSTLEFTPSRD
jgi:hypothetical protein